MMGVIINNLICVPLVLLAYSTVTVYGTEICTTSSIFDSPRVCNDGYYCCGTYNNQCCSDYTPSPGQSAAMEAFGSLVMLMMIVFCCVCCYRCCCRRTTNQGYVYTTPGTTTAVSVTLPPQQAMPQQQPMPPQHVPYPTVVPYPQQTPYPPQYNPQYNPPTNPYYGMPPPAYGMAVQSENQQSAPSAPYIQS